MGNWFFIGFAYVLTWSVLIAYTLYLRRRTRRAERLAPRLSPEDAGTGPFVEKTPTSITYAATGHPTDAEGAATRAGIR